MKKFIAIVIARALVAVSTNRAGCCTFASAADQDLLLAGHPYIDEPDAVAVATPGGPELVRTVSKSDSIRSMIIKGEKVDELDYPFMARFESKVGDKKRVCGGSLIAPCVLLTAKHCTHVQPGTEVKLGYYENIDGPVGGTREKFVVEEVATPSVVDVIEGGVGEDLMLVKINCESKATPVVLDAQDLVVDLCVLYPCTINTNRTKNLNVTIPGWGSTNFMDAHAFPKDLYKLDTKLTSKKACDHNIDMYFTNQKNIIKNQMICTLKDNHTSTFTGDSGGPLIVKGTNAQIGVLYGAPDTEKRAAGAKIASVYTNLRSPDVLWINKYINKEYDIYKENGTWRKCTKQPPSMQPSMNPSPYPSHSSGPSESPKPSMSPSESPKPSMSPSLSPTCHPSSTGHACGDPHFKTFDDHFFSYHGQCDLLLTRSYSFAHGMGLHVHIRTTRVSSPHMDYSYISGIAVKIGPDTLEMSGEGKIIVNGHSTIFPDFTDKIAFAGTDYTLTKTFMGSKQRIIAYNLDLGGDEDSIDSSSIQIRVNTKKSMLFVDMNGAFADSEGLLGAAAEEGKPLFARDGVTDLTGHWNTYGEEWQVNDTDLKLFQDSNRHPQYPQGCLYTTMDNDNKEATTTMSHVRRRLEDTGVTQHIVGLQEASKACSHLDHDDRMKDFCVNDVMATGDLDLVEDPFYAHA